MAALASLQSLACSEVSSSTNNYWLFKKEIWHQTPKFLFHQQPTCFSCCSFSHLALIYTSVTHGQNVVAWRWLFFSAMLMRFIFLNLLHPSRPLPCPVLTPTSVHAKPFSLTIWGEPLQHAFPALRMHTFFTLAEASLWPELLLSSLRLQTDKPIYWNGVWWLFILNYI